MRILVATPWLHSSAGGLERYATTLAREMRRIGHDVVEIGHGDSIPPAIRLSNTPLSLAIYRAARQVARGADIVNVHTPVPGTAELVAHAARREGVPYVVTYHAGRLAAPPGLLRIAAFLHERTFERRMLRHAAARIAVSPFVAANALCGLASDVVPPGVDVDRFRPVAEPVPGRVLFVGPVSRAYTWKGLSVLAAAMTLVRAPGAHLRIVGDGELAENYRAQGATVVGRVSDDTLVEEYARASVVVLPSTSAAESFGMCLAEANACARPVVASDVGGIPSFVREGENGMLVPAGDARALAAAIDRRLLDGHESRLMGARGRVRVEREHRWRDLADRTLAIYERARAGPAAP